MSISDEVGLGYWSFAELHRGATGGSMYDPFCIDRIAARVAATLPQAPRRPKDLTPRQIEWCRANLSSFMPKVINAPR